MRYENAEGVWEVAIAGEFVDVDVVSEVDVAVVALRMSSTLAGGAFVVTSLILGVGAVVVLSQTQASMDSESWRMGLRMPCTCPFITAKSESAASNSEIFASPLSDATARTNTDTPWDSKAMSPAQVEILERSSIRSTLRIEPVCTPRSNIALNAAVPTTESKKDTIALAGASFAPSSPISEAHRAIAPSVGAKMVKGNCEISARHGAKPA